MIAQLIADDGKEARFLLPTITIPPHHLIRKGKQWAVQPDWKMPKPGQHITAKYRLTSAPNIDIFDPMNEEQIAWEEKNGLEYVAPGEPLFPEETDEEADA